MNRRRLLAGLVSLTLLVASPFLLIGFATLSVAVGAWHGRNRSRDAYDRAQRTRAGISIAWAAAQIVGGTSAAVALGLEDGTIRGCSRRAYFYALAFFSVTTAITVLWAYYVIATARRRPANFPSTHR